MKIYTKTGDQGTSSLFSGERVSKNHPRMRAYGETDELNSIIGALGASLPSGTQEIREQLRRIQTDLFRAGAVLATSAESARADQIAPIIPEDIHRLEDYIDGLQAGLAELNRFILPAGHMSAAWAHVARTVCRRAERTVIQVVEGFDVRTLERRSFLRDVLIYLNRLSDYLFVVARRCNAAVGVDDVRWPE